MTGERERERYRGTDRAASSPQAQCKQTKVNFTVKCEGPIFLCIFTILCFYRETRLIKILIYYHGLGVLFIFPISLKLNPGSGDVCMEICVCLF